MAWQKHHNNLESQNISLEKVAAEMPLETECASTAEWQGHLKA
jgi:hypothetical protein